MCQTLVGILKQKPEMQRNDRMMRRKRFDRTDPVIALRSISGFYSPVDS
jgi:hypothetical protein